MQYLLIVLLSALLFGAATPLGKLLLESVPPFQLAGLLYLGAAVGVLPFSLAKGNTMRISRMGRKNVFRLTGAIVFGGIIGPVLLLFGLQLASSASVAMWLNLELAATALIGFFFFHDHLGRKGWLGVGGTFIASSLLSWHEGGIGPFAFLLVGGASVCWGLDNHLTALIDGITPTQSTFWKGMIAGVTNLTLSFFFEGFDTVLPMMGSAIIVGVFSYGFSISLYILAAQNMGATRAQMIFASAPFFGVVLSMLVLGERLSAMQIAAALLLVVSLVTLFRDHHSHFHEHVRVRHKHGHRHDDHHHGHDHGEGVATEPHSHWHEHEAKAHAHPHWPDIHHRHRH